MRQIFLFLTILLSSFPLPGQQGWQAEGFTGIGAGFIAMQNNFGGPELGYSYGLVPSFGMALVRNLTSLHLAGVEISYTQTRTNYHEQIGATTWGRDVKNHYLHLPLYFRGILGRREAKGLKGTYTWGGYAGWLKGANSTYFIDGKNVNFKTYLDTDPQNPYRNHLIIPRSDMELFRKTDIGLIIGLGLQFYIHPRWIVHLEGRASASLRDINAENYRGLKNRSGEVKESRNIWGIIQLRGGYCF